MDWKFVLALIFALIVAIFALQNAGAVDISFLTMDLSVSQALVILVSAVFGALAALLLGLVRWIKFQGKLKSLGKTANALEQENKQLKLKIESYEAQDAAKQETQNTSKGQTPEPGNSI